MKRINLRWWALSGVVACGLSVGEAPAATILGQVNFTGTVTLDAPLATATAFTEFSNVEVDTGTGDYEVPTLVPEGTSVTIAAFSFTSFTSPVAPVWAFDVGGTEYRFDLTAVAVTRGTIGGNDFLSLSGTGTARITGLEDTIGDFTLSAQQAVGAVGTTVTFSVENVVPSAPIPEPGVVGLAVAGLVGGLFWRRRRSPLRSGTGLSFEESREGDPD